MHQKRSARCVPTTVHDGRRHHAAQRAEDHRGPPDPEQQVLRAARLGDAPRGARAA